VLTSPLYPLSSRNHWQATTDIYGWRGEYSREGASPPLIFSPPLEQILLWGYGINLFERGTKGVSIDEQLNANSTAITSFFPPCEKTEWRIYHKSVKVYKNSVENT
jgi:hypothetical protein